MIFVIESHDEGRKEVFEAPDDFEKCIDVFFNKQLILKAKNAVILIEDEVKPIHSIIRPHQLFSICPGKYSEPTTVFPRYDKLKLISKEFLVYLVNSWKSLPAFFQYYKDAICIIENNVDNYYNEIMIKDIIE